MSSEENPYNVLDVSRSASAKELKRAFYKKVCEHPPERDKERYQDVVDAYETLKKHLYYKESDKRAANQSARTKSSNGKQSGSASKSTAVDSVDNNSKSNRSSLADEHSSSVGTKSSDSSSSSTPPSGESRRTNQEQDDLTPRKKKGEAWTVCPDCGVRLKEKNLNIHLGRKCKSENTGNKRNSGKRGNKSRYSAPSSREPRRTNQEHDDLTSRNKKGEGRTTCPECGERLKKKSLNIHLDRKCKSVSSQSKKDSTSNERSSKERSSGKKFSVSSIDDDSEIMALKILRIMFISTASIAGLWFVFIFIYGTFTILKRLLFG